MPPLSSEHRRGEESAPPRLRAPGHSPASGGASLATQPPRLAEFRPDGVNREWCDVDVLRARAGAARKFTGFTGGFVQPGKILEIFQNYLPGFNRSWPSKKYNM
jgi:hypothetical protein